MHQLTMVEIPKQQNTCRNWAAYFLQLLKLYGELLYLYFAPTFVPKQLKHVKLLPHPLLDNDGKEKQKRIKKKHIGKKKNKN